jgi:hypothetical protein
MVCRGCGEQHVPGKQEKPAMIPDASQASRQHLPSRPNPNRWNIRPCGCKLKLPVVSWFDVGLADDFLACKWCWVRVCTTSVQLDRSYSGHINKGHCCIVWWCFLKRHTLCGGVASLLDLSLALTCVHALDLLCVLCGPPSLSPAPASCSSLICNFIFSIHAFALYSFLFISFNFPCFSDPCCGEAHFGLLLVVYSSVVFFSSPCFQHREFSDFHISFGILLVI